MAELIQELKKEKDHLEKVIQAVEKGWQKFRLPFSQSFDMEKALPLELQRKQVAQMLGAQLILLIFVFGMRLVFQCARTGSIREMPSESGTTSIGKKFKRSLSWKTLLLQELLGFV